MNVRKIKSKYTRAIIALREIQHIYNGAGCSRYDLREVKKIAIRALDDLGVFEVSLHDLKNPKKKVGI